jgi:hypothetical protein
MSAADYSTTFTLMLPVNRPPSRDAPSSGSADERGLPVRAYLDSQLIV